MATPLIVIPENDTTESASTTAAGHLDNGQQPAEAGTSGKFVDGSKENPDNSTSNDTSDSDMTTSGPEDQDDEDFIFVNTRRKLKRKIENASDEESRKKAIVALGPTILFALQDPTIVLNNLNSLKLTEALNSHAPTEVGEIHCNKRLNILAVDTQNQESTASLLRIRKLVGIAVRAYEPRNPNTAVGLIWDVDASILEKVLLRNLSANTTKITQECSQHTSPGPDGVTYRALANLGPLALDALLNNATLLPMSFLPLVSQVISAHHLAAIVPELQTAQLSWTFPAAFSVKLPGPATPEFRKHSGVLRFSTLAREQSDVRTSLPWPERPFQDLATVAFYPGPSPTSWRCWASTQERPAPRTRSASDAYVLKRIFPLALLASARRWCFWYAAYRQWMLWLGLRLGQSNRRPLPSCMVKTIRD
ncbi:uncharacterized protein ISCGN_005098 [Ixodes scapularis]